MTGKQIVATKGQLKSVYRLIDRDMYLQGVASKEYYQLVGNFKQKGALKSTKTSGGWIKITFIDEIPIEGLHGEFFNAMVTALKGMGFSCEVTEI